MVIRSELLGCLASRLLGLEWRTLKIGRGRNGRQTRSGNTIASSTFKPSETRQFGARALDPDGTDLANRATDCAHRQASALLYLSTRLADCPACACLRWSGTKRASMDTTWPLSAAVVALVILQVNLARHELGSWLAPGAFFGLMWAVVGVLSLSIAPELRIWPGIVWILFMSCSRPSRGSPGLERREFLV